MKKIGKKIQSILNKIIIKGKKFKFFRDILRDKNFGKRINVIIRKAPMLLRQLDALLKIILN